MNILPGACFLFHLAVTQVPWITIVGKYTLGGFDPGPFGVRSYSRWQPPIFDSFQIVSDFHPLPNTFRVYRSCMLRARIAKMHSQFMITRAYFQWKTGRFVRDLKEQLIPDFVIRPIAAKPAFGERAWQHSANAENLDSVWNRLTTFDTVWQRLTASDNVWQPLA